MAGGRASPATATYLRWTHGDDLHRRGDPGRSPATRELAHLTITKLAVDPKMSNNAYLLPCRATGELVLIDAADEPAALLELCDSALEGVITTHQHWDHHRALAEVVGATGATTSPGSRTPTPITEQTGVAVDARSGTATGSRSATASWR